MCLAEVDAHLLLCIRVILRGNYRLSDRSLPSESSKSHAKTRDWIVGLGDNFNEQQAMKVAIARYVTLAILNDTIISIKSPPLEQNEMPTPDEWLIVVVAKMSALTKV